MWMELPLFAPPMLMLLTMALLVSTVSVMTMMVMSIMVRVWMMTPMRKYIIDVLVPNPIEESIMNVVKYQEVAEVTKRRMAVVLIITLETTATTVLGILPASSALVILIHIQTVIVFC